MISKELNDRFLEIEITDPCTELHQKERSEFVFAKEEESLAELPVHLLQIRNGSVLQKITEM